MSDIKVRRSVRKRRPSAKILSSSFIQSIPKCSDEKQKQWPTSGDIIFVKWELLSKVVWWKALILEVSSCNSKSKCLSGKIQYYKMGRYPPETADVQFVSDKSSGNLVVTKGTDEYCSWMFSTKPDEDCESNHNTSSLTTARKENHLYRNISPINALKNNNNTKTTNQSFHIDFLLKQVNRLNLDISILRDQGPAIYKELIVNAILNQLKYALLLKLQCKLKSPTSSDNSQALLQQYVVISVDCSLNCFSLICSHVQSCLTPASFTDSNNGSSPRKITEFSFIPPYSVYQQPSLSSESLHILFSSMTQLCKTLNLRDSDDFENMFCRELIDKSMHVMHLVGVIRNVKSNDSNNPPINILSFNGSSNYSLPNEPASKTTTGTKPTATTPVTTPVTNTKQISTLESSTKSSKANEDYDVATAKSNISNENHTKDIDNADCNIKQIVVGVPQFNVSTDVSSSLKHTILE